MCTDPNAAKEIAEIKAEIVNLEHRILELEHAVNGDGSKEKGIVPRLAAIETKLNALLWLLGTAVGAIATAAGKYLFGG
jgi:hypothetical protein